MTVYVETEGGLSRSTYDSERYLTAKLGYIEELGGVCALCGSRDDLEFDHIDPETKTCAVMSKWTRPDLVREEMVKCQLLCKPCHQQKTLEQISVPHGGGKGGKRKCKCDPCRLRRNEYMSEYKKLRRQGAR